jgi:hypothetical protein
MVSSARARGNGFFSGSRVEVVVLPAGSGSATTNLVPSIERALQPVYRLPLPVMTSSICRRKDFWRIEKVRSSGKIFDLHQPDDPSHRP